MRKNACRYNKNNKMKQKKGGLREVKQSPVQVKMGFKKQVLKSVEASKMHIYIHIFKFQTVKQLKIMQYFLLL